MSDLIDRQAAIDAFGELATFTEDWSCHTWMYTDDVYNAIKQLPSIQPEPQYKTDYGFMWLCPKCGLPIHSDYTRCVRCGHNRINEQPTIQPEIVRYKDCEHGVLDDGFPHQYFCIFKGDEWNNADYFCGHAKRREVTT